MDVFQLVVVDTAQIQPYIYGSNRLRENVGASHLVWQATEVWPHEVLKQLFPSSAIAGQGHAETKQIENESSISAEVLYAGGGNFVALFRERDGAEKFIRQLSEMALTLAPGLQLVAVSEPCQWADLPARVGEVISQNLAQEKRSRTLSAPLLGMGVTRACQSTGGPAVDWLNTPDGSKLAASAEILAKWGANEPANKRLGKEFREVLGKDYEFPYDFENLGRSPEEFSYIAVVHADGDGMGLRIRAISDKFQGEPRKYIDAMRGFSQGLESAAHAALEGTLKLLIAAIDKEDKAIVHSNRHQTELGRVALAWDADARRWFLPIRPLVYGGDDVTFVCDGRLGLSLAQEFMRQFNQQTINLPDNAGAATACAGISIVKSHYPFSQAYHLAEELARSAKGYRLKFSAEKPACLDWHFALSGLYGDLEMIRRRELHSPSGSLTLRPVTLSDNSLQAYRSWPVIEKLTRSFQDDWVSRRSKMKLLREALRSGPQDVENFIARYNQGHKLPPLDGGAQTWDHDFAGTGWYFFEEGEEDQKIKKGHCGYFEAVELADWWIPLVRREP